MLISMVLFTYHNVSTNQKKEDIYPSLLDGCIWENEINLDKFMEYQTETYWIENSTLRKFNNFNFKKVDELGKIFGMWYRIGFDKKLYEKISDVSFELEMPDSGKENFMYYCVSSEHPFDGFLIEDNGDGAYQIVMIGATRDKSYKEIEDMAQSVVINLKIQYYDGRIETRPMKFDKAITKVDSSKKGETLDILVKENPNE